MGRPERPIAEDGGPVAVFAADLRRLRAEAGSPTYRRLAQQAHYAPSVLSHATRGSRLASWDVVSAFVRACGGDVAAWQARWRALADAQHGPGGSAAASDADPDAEGVDTSFPRPRQLPAGTRHFLGRDRELRSLTILLDRIADSAGPVVVSAVGGVGGVGKTSLAVAWARRHAARFPDGQLFVNLRGFDPSGQPVTVAAALRGFLDALGVAPAAVPQDSEAQSALYRSLVADKRILVILDNAADAEQVVPLLPGTPDCRVIVTSRLRLDGLVVTHGATLLDLDVLGEADARNVLNAHVGADRLGAEPEAAAELLRHCAGLPLALGIVAARAAAHPGFPLKALAEELRDDADRLDALETGDSVGSVRGVLSWSYRALSREAVAVFDLFGLTASPDIPLAAAASLAGYPLTRTRAVLRELDAAHLVAQPSPGRYRMHDLVRLYATEQAHRNLPDSEREAASDRLIDFYLHTAFVGDRILGPFRTPIELDTPAPACLPHPLTGYDQTLAWFDAERPGLLAAQRLAVDRGRHARVWQLAWAQVSYHFRRGHLDDQLAAWRAGIAAAEHLRDPAAQAMCLRFLGDGCIRTGRPAEALDHLRRALTIAEEAGLETYQAHIHQSLAWALAQQQENQQALEHASDALRVYQGLKDPVLEAEALNAVGWYAARLGRYDDAQSACEAGLTLFREHRHRDGESATLDSLGYIAHAAGRHARALEYYHQALALRRELGNTYGEANILDHLGQPYAALGQTEQARDTWLQALAMYRAQKRADDTERVERHLAALDPPPDDQVTTGRSSPAAARPT